MNKDVLKKVSIKKRKGNGSFWVEDIFSLEELIMNIPGKLRMNYINFSVNEMVYMVTPNEDSKEGKYVIEKYICFRAENSELCQQKRKIEILEKK
ncbi:MAG: hypothetical protein ACPG19_10490 [Saprospiraceae bacterium]